MAIACTLEDVRRWYERDLSRYASWEESVEALDDGSRSPDAVETGLSGPQIERRLRFRIYTDTNYYTISASEGTEEREGYLGCQGSSRKPRAGEGWTRGNDLPDGPLTEATWRDILAAIVSYELVRVHRRQEPAAIMLGVASRANTDDIPMPSLTPATRPVN